MTDLDCTADKRCMGSVCEQRLRRYSSAMMGTGIAFSAIGGVLLVAGITVAGAGSLRTYVEPYDEEYSNEDPPVKKCDAQSAFNTPECETLGSGIIMIPVGITVALVGVILAATGARKVPVRPVAGGSHVALATGSQNRNNDQRDIRLELVGLAPLADREAKPSGIAAQWVF